MRIDERDDEGERAIVVGVESLQELDGFRRVPAVEVGAATAEVIRVGVLAAFGGTQPRKPYAATSALDGSPPSSPLLMCHLPR